MQYIKYAHIHQVYIAFVRLCKKKKGERERENLRKKLYGC